MKPSTRMSVSPLAYLKNHVKTSRNFLYMWLWLWLWLSPRLGLCSTLCTSGFVDDIMFSHGSTCAVYSEAYGRGMSVSRRQWGRDGRASALQLCPSVGCLPRTDIARPVWLWRQTLCCTWGQCLSSWIALFKSPSSYNFSSCFQFSPYTHMLMLPLLGDPIFTHMQIQCVRSHSCRSHIHVGSCKLGV